MRLTSLVIACGLAISLHAQGTMKLPRARLIAHVIDEAGTPVEGAEVEVFFMNPNGSMDRQIGYTAIDGTYAAEGFSDGGVGTRVSKAGYYVSGLGVPNFAQLDASEARWQPWGNTHTAVLRKIGKPIGLYARHVYARVPKAEARIGFDLKRADWVAPYGTGTLSDFIVTVKTIDATEDSHHWEARISFPNPTDGIQLAGNHPEFAGSEFQWAREAPEFNYLSQLSLRAGWVTDSRFRVWSKRTEPNTQFFFRVESSSEGGRVLGYYGKMPSGFVFTVSENGDRFGLEFTYYLNPNLNDRNLEYDRTKNLFIGLRGDAAPNGI